MINGLRNLFSGEKTHAEDLVIKGKNRTIVIPKSASIKEKHDQIKKLYADIKSSKSEEISDPALYAESAGKIVQYMDNLKASEKSLPSRIFMRVWGFKKLRNNFEALSRDFNQVAKARLEESGKPPSSQNNQVVEKDQEQEFTDSHIDLNDENNDFLNNDEGHSFIENSGSHAIESQEELSLFIPEKNQSIAEKEPLELHIEIQSEPSESKESLEISENIKVNEVSQERQSVEGKKVYNDMLVDLFYASPPAPGNGELVVTGRVMGDGMGDYFHMRGMASELRKRYVDREVRMVVLSAIEHTGKLQPPQGKENTTHIAYETEDPWESKLNLFKDINPLQIVKDASLVIVGPVSPQMYGGVGAELGEKGVAICEYDNKSQMVQHYCRTILPMGLSEENLGIMTKSDKDYSWDMIEGNRLKEILFEEDKGITPEDKNIFLSYLPDLEQAYNFIDQAVFFTAGDNKDVDIISPRKELLTLVGLQENVNLEAWKETGVGSIKVISYVQGEKVEEILRLSDSGKEVRLVNTEQILNKDFKILTKLSNPLMACTGDKSIERAIQYGKIPYYTAPGHKVGFRYAIESEIARVTSTEAPLYKYFRNQENSEGKKLLAEHREEIIRDAQIFSQKIKEERSFNKSFLGVVNQKLYTLEHPHLKELVQKLQKEYENGDKDLAQVKRELQGEINAIHQTG